MEFIRACNDLAKAVSDAVDGMVGTPEAGEFVKMGADGTPTKLIDQVAEDIIVDYFRGHLCCRHLISEELGCADMGGEKGTIYLDPVDGTYNAVVGIPYYALSIAYAEEGVVQKGYVRNLATGETFHAIKGKGAFLDGHPIHVSQTALLEESAMSIYGRKFDPTRMFEIARKIRRLRLLGASALMSGAAASMGSSTCGGRSVSPTQQQGCLSAKKRAEWSPIPRGEYLPSPTRLPPGGASSSRTASCTTRSSST